jgi:hypothetical protein
VRAQAEYRSTCLALIRDYVKDLPESFLTTNPAQFTASMKTLLSALMPKKSVHAHYATHNLQQTQPTNETLDSPRRRRRVMLLCCPTYSRSWAGGTWSSVRSLRACQSAFCFFPWRYYQQAHDISSSADHPRDPPFTQTVVKELMVVVLQTKAPYSAAQKAIALKVSQRRESQ